MVLINVAVILLAVQTELIIGSYEPNPLANDNDNDARSLEADADNAAEISDDKNIAFELPDLTATIETTAGGHYQIEAYKSVHNDRIMLQDTEGKQTAGSTSQLFWVSVGQPTFVKTPVSTSTRGRDPSMVKRLFHYSTLGFYTYVQMLTPAQRVLLAAAVNDKYHGVNVSEKQIVNLILSKFECSLQLFDDADNKYLITGMVTNFRNFPLRIDFKAPRDSIERKLFIEHLGSDDSDEIPDMHFVCRMSSRGKLTRTNTLSIDLRQLEEIGLIDKLFGSSTTEKEPESVYVTRDQMTELSREMYSTLNIVEDYQMSELQFSEGFIDGLISQAAAGHFAQVPIDAALATLSTYGFNFHADLTPDQIKRDLGSVLKVEQRGEKSHIVLDEEKLKELQVSAGASLGASVSGGDFTGSAEASLSASVNKIDKTKSLNDQLKELNQASQNQVQWEIEGIRIVPKSLNVARLQRSRAQRTMTFRRVRIQTFVAAFDRQFSVYTQRDVRNPELPSVVRRLETRLDLFDINATKSESAIRRLETRLDLLDANAQKSEGYERLKQLDADAKIGELNSAVLEVRNKIGAVQVRAIVRCRICFSSHYKCKVSDKYKVNGDVHAHLCSGWSDSPEWTKEFIDGNYNVYDCGYKFKLECQR